MERYIGQDFKYNITNQELSKHLRLDEDQKDEDYLKAVSMLGEAQACARPKFVYAVAAIDTRGSDYVNVEGHRFDSELVSRNLAKVHRIFPYIVTCGSEAEQCWAEEIKILLMRKAMAELRSTIRKRHFPDVESVSSEMARMTPGSLPAWPLTQQRALFGLLGDLPAQIGVSLTDSCLMLPSKSGSGFFFTSDTDFVNCKLCPLFNCPNRSAEYQQ